MESSTPNQKQHAPPDINLSVLLEEAKSKLEEVQTQHAPPDINLSAVLQEAKSKLEQVEKLSDAVSRLSDDSMSCFVPLFDMLQSYEIDLDKDMSILKNLIKIGGKLSVYEAWVRQQGLNSPNVDPKELVSLQKAKQGVFEKIRNHKIAPPPSTSGSHTKPNGVFDPFKTQVRETLYGWHCERCGRDYSQAKELIEKTEADIREAQILLDVFKLQIAGKEQPYDG
ncbi:hypothetical protein N0V85_009523, partial [Neurospora sp. IMI 360204]